MPRPSLQILLLQQVWSSCRELTVLRTIKLALEVVEHLVSYLFLSIFSLQRKQLRRKLRSIFYISVKNCASILCHAHEEPSTAGKNNCKFELLSS